MRNRVNLGKLASGAVIALGLTAMGGSVSASADPAGVLVDARPCSTSYPKTIRLVLGPGAVVCYGGTVGYNPIDNFWVQSLVAGDYTGALSCNTDVQGIGKIYNFRPGDIMSIGRTCYKIAIKPA